MKKDFCILEVKNGAIVNRTQLVKLIHGLKDGRYQVEFSSLSKRSLPQNKFYWALVIPMIQQGIEDLGTELTKEETHEFLKSKFNSEELVNTETGEVLSIPRSTTVLTKEQFSNYIEKIQRFASEFLNIVIPDPGVQTTINY